MTKLTSDANGNATIPSNQCRLIGESFGVLQAAASGEKGADSRRRFEMVATSGRPFAHPWFGTLAVRLDGIKWDGDKMPVLLNHDPLVRLGVATKLTVDKKRGLVAEGTMLSNADAAQVCADCDEGFPWQASVYLRASKVLEVRDGEEHEVNGHKFTGPGYVFEESTLREVTICALGADPNTNTTTLADSDVVVTLTHNSNPMTTKKDEAPAGGSPDQNKDNTAALAQATASGTTSERERVGRILKAASHVQAELRDKLIADGTPLADAMEALAIDARGRLTAHLAAAGAAGGSTPTGAGNKGGGAAGEDPAKAALARIAAMPDGEERWKEEWKNDAALRTEFNGSEGVWLSYCRNKHRCRAYRSSQQWADDSKDAVRETPATLSEK